MPGIVDVRLPLPEFSAGHVHDLTRRILAEHQFHQPPKPWVQRATDWIDRELARVLSDLASGSSAGAIAWVIVGIAVVVAAVLLRRFLRRVRVDPGAQSEDRPVQRRSAADWDDLATAHRAAGEWRDAVRCEYRALIATLAERGVVDDIPGRTAREYGRLVGVDEFNEATELFEAVWYGNADTGEEEEKRLRNLGRRILASAGGR